MKRHVFRWLPFIAALLALLLVMPAKGIAPSPQPTTVPTPSSTLPARILLLPLDSRPPCTDFVVELAQLAGMQVILPPPELLDHYRRPASPEKLAAWAATVLKEEKPDAVILSTDMLVHGSLLASRQRIGKKEQEQQLLNWLTQWHKEYPAVPLYAFSIIPRLLLADNSPYQIYQYHLKKYSIWADEIGWFDNPDDVQPLLAMEKRLPEELKTEYAALYEQNLAFNRSLIDLAASGTLQMLILGQDDGFPFGLPNQEKEQLAQYAAQKKAHSVEITRGTDEVALSLLGKIISQQRTHAAQAEIRYSRPDVPGMLMPYMPHSIASNAKEKLALSGVLPATEGNADFILYIHAGRKGDSPWQQLAPSQEIASLLQEGKAVALVDLSEDFSSLNTIYPWLVLLDVPVNQLTAYAGWNTTSNSLGTIVTHALAVLQGHASTTKKASFLGERFLDDWYYQKTIQSRLNRWLLAKRQDPYSLKQNYAEANFRLQRHLQSSAVHLERYDFPATNATLPLRRYDATAKTPWERTFEASIELKVQ